MCNVVRGCDTSQVAFMVKNNATGCDDFVEYVRDGVDIDLAEDKYSTSSMLTLRDKINGQFKAYDVLDSEENA